MRQNKKAYIKKVKNKNMAFNFLVAMNVIFGTIPNIIVLYMVGLMLDGGLTQSAILRCGMGIAGCLALKALFYGLSIWKAHDTVPLMLLFSKGMNKLFSDSVKRYWNSTKKLSEDLLEYISTISVIKAFSREEQKTRNILDSMRDYNRWVKKFTLSLTVPMRLTDMILEGGFVVMVIVGSQLLADGRVSTQEFVLALILGGIFTASFAKLQIFHHSGLDQGRWAVSDALAVAGGQGMAVDRIWKIIAESMAYI